MPVKVKVRIMMPHHNSYEFIGIQVKTIRNFIRDEEYEIIVFDDSVDESSQKLHQNECIEHKVTYVPVPQKIHMMPTYLQRYSDEPLSSPSVRNVNVVQWIYDNYALEFDGIVAFLDCDMFPTYPFSFNEYLSSGYHIVTQFLCFDADTKGINYMWLGFLVINMKLLDDKEKFSVNSGYITKHKKCHWRIDAGAATYWHIHNHHERGKLRGNYYHVVCTCKAKGNNVGCRCSILSTHTLAMIQKDELICSKYKKDQPTEITNAITDMTIYHGWIHTVSGSKWRMTKNMKYLSDWNLERIQNLQKWSGTLKESDDSSANVSNVGFLIDFNDMSDIKFDVPIDPNYERYVYSLTI